MLGYQIGSLMPAWNLSWGKAGDLCVVLTLKTDEPTHRCQPHQIKHLAMNLYDN